MTADTIRVYDPAMCCSTGVCGPTVDPELVRFARDVAWLKHHGVDVERFNLAQEPAAFVQNPTILSLMQEQDSSVLPVVLVGDQVVATGAYPSRQELERLVGLPEDDS